MSVPKEIQQVPRPANTTVYAYGIHKDRYGVRERIGTKVCNGKTRPVYGKVVGHIVNHMFIPKREKEPAAKPPKTRKPKKECKPEPEKESKKQSTQKYKEAREFGLFELLQRHCPDIAADLDIAFDLNADLSDPLFALAALEVQDPDLEQDFELERAWNKSWFSMLCPELRITQRNLEYLLQRAGSQPLAMLSFLQDLAGPIKESDVQAFDTSLNQELITERAEGKSFEAYLKSARLCARFDKIAIFYALHQPDFELAALQAFPLISESDLESDQDTKTGNLSENPKSPFQEYCDFLQAKKLKEDLVISSQPLNQADFAQLCLGYPNLHFLCAISQEDERISQLELKHYQGVLPGHRGLLYEKTSCSDPKTNKTIYYYSFLNLNVAGDEMIEWGIRQSRHPEGNFGELFEKNYYNFGTSLFQSDLDLEPRRAYTLICGCVPIFCLLKLACQLFEDIAAAKRKSHKHAYRDQYGDEGEKELHDRMLGFEFLHFVSLVIEEQIAGLLRKQGILEDASFEQVMKRLKRIKLAKLPGQEDYDLLPVPSTVIALAKRLDLDLDLPLLQIKSKAKSNSSPLKAKPKSKSAKAKGSSKAKTNRQNQKFSERESLQNIKQPDHPILTAAEAAIEHTARIKRGQAPDAKSSQSR